MAIDAIDSGRLNAPQTQRSEAGGGQVAQALTQLLLDVNSDQLKAGQAMKRLVVDGEGSIHEAMVAMNTAEGSFRLLMEMRNRLVDGFNRLLQTRG